MVDKAFHSFSSDGNKIITPVLRLYLFFFFHSFSLNMSHALLPFQGIEVVGGIDPETVSEPMWAPMVDEQIRIDEEDGKYKYPGIDAPLESEENDDFDD